MASFTVKASCVSVLFLLAAYLYNRGGEEELQTRLQNVLSGLLRAEKKVSLLSRPRVAVGFGSCMDVIAEGMVVLEKIGAIPPDVPQHQDNINSKRDLEEIFAYFFRHGAAAERYISNSSLFLELTSAALSLPHTSTALGGNAPVMASRFHKEGCQVLLGAQKSVNLRSHLDSDITITGGELQEDDIHLLLEYSRDATWGKYQSNRANRFIFHSDVSNPTLSSLEEFASELTAFSPTLLVIGGLQMMDSFPFLPGQRKSRLELLRNIIKDTPRETRTHFEMASFAEESCMNDVMEHVVYYSDSLGMNEQELPNLHSLLSNGTVTLVSDPYPRVATTLDQMRDVYRILHSTAEGEGRRQLTRLHVHTLAFQAIMTTKGSSWKNTMSAAAKASLTANRHTCGSNAISLEKARIIMDHSFSTSRKEGSSRVPVEDDRPVSCWTEDDYDICIAPVLVCTDVVQTGGGGDNVSSAGLVLQI